MEITPFERTLLNGSTMAPILG
ncbi:hypothetical protein U0070_004781 [Myodes glareolus]|uniref:Uncharacterized protein n=1 Tax=Myodes glareolus TaxID=447135 RepID=A0AAW0HV78_MYOGA